MKKQKVNIKTPLGYSFKQSTFYPFHIDSIYAYGKMNVCMSVLCIIIRLL